MEWILSASYNYTSFPRISKAKAVELEGGSTVILSYD
jgi:hypothetical protein